MELILEQFLAEEAVPYVRKLIVDAVSEHQAKPNELQKRFEFNRFELTLDFENKSVLIEDILQTGQNGEIHLALDEFLRHIIRP